MTPSILAPYLELPSRDLAATKRFFHAVFGWQFTDYGDAYTAFDSNYNLGGFYLADKVSHTSSGACLIVLYSKHLESTRQKVIDSGGLISVDIFTFPGGRRFQFTEPGGSELAVWTDQ
ncbi:VOC family protein [Gilvimarinus xylanilyticus]|uniref:VOC family protein n=1 Tax=Gilvimarinus xylanilyticus TaxID=2944139 RepID=A0A9X2KV39_9GAMM|nr:VOC family protein [Gilvimarinus xylanilyticus]MCP8900523.1 VOC family protein [Gilvimarinus xylanilyticus]